MSDKGPPRIIDTTLRDGEQAAGVAFSSTIRLRIARALVAAGLRELEALVPAMGPDTEEEFALLADEAGADRLIAWNRMRRSDADASFRASAKTVHLSVPASDAMLQGKLGWSRARALEETKVLTAYCRDRGADVIVGAEDASRADPSFVVDLAGTAAAAGAFRFRYADTLGLHDPFAAYRAARSLAEGIGVELEYHAHNDLGLATANALAAAAAGAAVSATVCGLGERAGNAALEQVVAALELQRGESTGVDLLRLPALCALVAEASGRPIPADKPIVGAAAFAHESGIHVDGLLKDPSLYEFVRPETFGLSRSFVPGRHSGRAALRHCARALGRTVEAAELDGLSARVRARWEAGAPADPWRAFAELLGEGGDAR